MTKQQQQPLPPRPSAWRRHQQQIGGGEQFWPFPETGQDPGASCAQRREEDAAFDRRQHEIREDERNERVGGKHEDRAARREARAVSLLYSDVDVTADAE